MTIKSFDQCFLLKSEVDQSTQQEIQVRQLISVEAEGVTVFTLNLILGSKIEQVTFHPYFSGEKPHFYLPNVHV